MVKSIVPPPSGVAAKVTLMAAPPPLQGHHHNMQTRGENTNLPGAWSPDSYEDRSSPSLVDRRRYGKRVQEPIFCPIQYCSEWTNKMRDHVTGQACADLLVRPHPELTGSLECFRKPCPYTGGCRPFSDRRATPVLLRIARNCGQPVGPYPFSLWCICHGPPCGGGRQETCPAVDVSVPDQTGILLGRNPMEDHQEEVDKASDLNDICNATVVPVKNLLGGSLVS